MLEMEYASDSLMNGTLQILVVDDHAIVREGVVGILVEAAWPWSIAQAAGGDDALVELGTRRTHLIVTDMSMPGLCGLDLIRRLHVGWPDLRILVLSMHADVVLATRAFQAGAHGYLTKDHAGSELVDAVLRVAGGDNYMARDIAEHATASAVGKSWGGANASTPRAAARAARGEGRQSAGRGFS